MSSQQRDVICKVEGADRNNTVLLLYIKQSNKNRVEGAHPNNLLTLDTAGYFTRQSDAQNVAACLNRLIPLNQINGKYRRWTDYYVQLQDKLYSVRAWYEAVGIFAPHEHIMEVIISVVKTKAKLNYRKVNSFFENADPEILVEGPFIKRYVVNDIMPTMHLDDYNLINHKERFDKVVEHLKLLPGSHDTRRRGRITHRKVPNIIQHSDSSDSEDESKWRGVTDRSLITPNLMDPPLLRPLPRQSKRLERKRVQNPPAQSKKRVKPQSPSVRRSKRLKK
jgi:hypothetical protein